MPARLRLLAAVVAGSLTLAAGCGGDAKPDAVLSAGAYAAVISWAVRTLPPVKPSPQPLVFVQARGASGIPLNVQAAVVQQLDGKVSVRFVDDRTEAVDAGAELDPVRRGGLLVTTGIVPAGEPAVDVPVTLYQRSDASRSYRVTLARQDGRWVVTTAAEVAGRG